MTIRELILQLNHFDALGVEVLLAHVLGVSRAYLVAHSEEVLTPEAEKQFRSFYERLEAGEPVAYLTGEKEFYGLDFFVDSSVLIPRPETEMLVEKVLAFALKDGTWGAPHEKILRIVDVGTGSGAIAVSLAKHLPEASIVGTDISEEALVIARKNAEIHGVAVDFRSAHLLEGMDEPFDVVVANLPYIGKKQYRFVSRETEKYEPPLALFGGDDGLELYRELFQQISLKASKPQLLLGEFGFAQGEKMVELLNTFFKQKDWHIEKDYASIDRIFVVTFSSL